jgi:hypothetical protein
LLVNSSRPGAAELSSIITFAPGGLFYPKCWWRDRDGRIQVVDYSLQRNIFELDWIYCELFQTTCPKRILTKNK